MNGLILRPSLQMGEDRNIAAFHASSNPDEGPPDPEKRSAAEAGNFDGTDYQHKAWGLQLYNTATALLQDRWCIGDEPTMFLIAVHIIDLWNSGVRMPELLTKVCTGFPHASQSEIEGGAALVIALEVRP